jgi:uncharacterized tellurite resistance protein B-like protein
MAMADGSLGEREVNLIADRCEQLGLSAVDLQNAVEFGLGDDAALEFPQDNQERMVLMQDLIRMMGADGHLAEGEKRLFALAAARMNITDSKLDELIRSALPSTES